METVFENRPHDYVVGECVECGFFYYTVVDQMPLKDVNWRRREAGLKPLKRLKKQVRYPWE
jgi:5-formaminoimidazole-4-carboxamide-1-beta-D-ribofuranosyl 5'-monophosphate synthetase